MVEELEGLEELYKLPLLHAPTCPCMNLTQLKSKDEIEIFEKLCKEKNKEI